MTKKDIKFRAAGFNVKTNPTIPKLPEDKQQAIYQELKSSGSIDNPIKYTETHLEGGIEGDF